jgi:hypothetical protein
MPGLSKIGSGRIDTDTAEELSMQDIRFSIENDLKYSQISASQFSIDELKCEIKVQEFEALKSRITTVETRARGISEMLKSVRLQAS